MIGPRAIVLAMLIVAGSAFGPAQAQSTLAAIDRELNVLCGRYTGGFADDAAAIRLRLAQLWRQRKAQLAALPADRRAEEIRFAAISADCLATAENATKASHFPAVYRDLKGLKYRTPGLSGPQIEILPDSKALPQPDAGARATSKPTVRSAPSRAPASVGPPRAKTAAPSSGRSPAAKGAVVDTAKPLAPAGNGKTAANTGPAELQEFFPWPPPAPSDRRLLALTQLGGDAPPKTWGDVADRMIALMRGGQYPTWGFYSAPGGFAVIPHIEQLDSASGKALADDARWATEVKLASLNFFQRFATVQLPKGVYRTLVFVLTTDPKTSGAFTDAKRALEHAKQWATSGALDLPHALRGNKIDDAQRFFILLYEFETEVGGQTKVNTSARWRIEHHLKDAGIEIRP